MNASFAKLISRRFRRLSAVVCLIAVTLQVAWPALHAVHERTHHPHGAIATTSTLETTSAFDDHESRHDAASCPACRIASQLKSITTPAVFAGVVTVHAEDIAARRSDALRSQAAVRAGPSRAPPLLA